MTQKGETGACLIVGPRGGAFEAAAQRVFDACASMGLQLARSWWSPEHLSNPLTGEAFAEQRELLVRDLATALVAVIDIGAEPATAFYLLGAREALTSNITLAAHGEGGPPPWAVAFLRPRFINIAACDGAALAALVAPLKDAAQQAWTNDFRAARAVDVRERSPILNAEGVAKRRGELAEAEQATNWLAPWRLPDVKTPHVGLRCGDIRDVTDVTCWVNSENVNMQMARDIEKSVSARIRWLGARHTGVDREFSDDAIFLDLARAMGARRRLEIGEVIMTTVQRRTPLFEKNHVCAVAHVATVVPAGPGEGFRPGGDIEGCVRNALTRIHEYALDQRLDLSTVLFPLLAAGDGGLHASVVASQIVGALRDWAAGGGKEQEYFKGVYLMARDAAARDAIRYALRMYGFTEEAKP